MTTSTPGPGSPDGFRRAFRPADARLVGGVAAGLAEHLDIPVLAVRAGFVVATFFSGSGVVAYLLLWSFLPLQASATTAGLESAERRGLRSTRRTSRRETVQSLAIAAVGLGVLGLVMLTGGALSGWILPLLLIVGGVAVVWRLIDDTTWNSWLRQTRGPGFWVRLLLGLSFIALGVAYLLTVSRGVGAAVDFGAALAIALVGLSLLLGPWLLRLRADLGRERRERIRSQERADVAAHLHDSVLQTLALVQKNAADPQTVATLARRQERELREWLYGRTDAPATLASGVREIAADVENHHRVPVEVVTVGDAPDGARVRALLAATREAVVNAAKHSGADRVDVYTERTPVGMEVFVRDRGAGFDPATVADDRRGISDSITARMERHGGTASIHSTPGDGTEVVLALPLGPEES